MKTAIIVAIILVLLFIGYAAYNYFSSQQVAEPKYKTIKQQHSISIREYEPMLIAEVTATGSRKEAISSGFRVLADYIFGNNKSIDNNKIAMTAPVMQQKSQKIAMTAPVMQARSSAETWHIRFVMPQKFTLKNLPKPNNKSIKVYQQDASKFVVITFSGTASPANLNNHLIKLQKYIENSKIKTSGTAIYAFYNPPWTLPFMRRNEILMLINN